MINKILNFILKNNLIPQNSKILVGLSGGPDSVFLLHILKNLQNKLKIDIIAAHLDHEWRTNSYLDIELCKKITDELRIPFICAKASQLNLNLKKTGSKEEVGRIMRRKFFEQIAKEQDANKIALAHHLNDQQETFLIRLIRGTTLSGLTGINSLDGIYIRPLLEIKKEEILNYLKENKIPYLIDPSNISDEFLRNRIRKVIPSLQECDKRFDDNFLRTLNKLRETEDFLEKIIEEKFNEISIKKEENHELNLKQLFNFDQFLQYKIIILWIIKSDIKFELTESFLNEILRFLKQPGSAEHKIHHEWKIQKKKGIAKIAKF